MEEDTNLGKAPPIVALFMVLAGAIIAILGRLGAAAIIGGAIALLGCIPASYGLWAGIQQKTQTTLALSILMILVCLGAGFLLLAISIFGWL